MANILVVDDDRDLGDLLAMVLVEFGHNVRIARNGREGLAAIDDEHPDAIILDIEMPVLDGPGMAHEILIQDAGREKIPIILVSGYVDHGIVAKRIGTPYFASKPCTLDALVDLLDRALTERTAPTPHASTLVSPSPWR